MLSRNIRATFRYLAKHKAETISSVIGLLLFHSILLAKDYHGTSFDAAKAGQFGDFVGGYFGPILSLVGIVLLINTLREERRSAENQEFQSRYFQLLKMHHDNVDDMRLRKLKGRRIFVFLLREWRSALEHVRGIALKTGTQLTRQQAIFIAYYCVFYGAGENSSRMLRGALADFDPTFVTSLEITLADQEIRKDVRSKEDLPYDPFDGNQSRLGHYYRHLYQTVRFVDEGPRDLNKKSYMKTIRAQLSTHEQALLLLNSLSPIGSKWWTDKLIDRYKLVRNLPREFFSPTTELDLMLLFDQDYFEHEELESLSFIPLCSPDLPTENAAGGSPFY